MTVRICSHRRLLLPMQSDVLNEQQQQLSNDIDCSSSLSTTTLIYSGLKLHPKPLVPTISMPGVASPLSIVKKLSLPDSHLDNPNHNIKRSSPPSSTTTPSSIRLVTPTTTKSSSPTNGTFSTSKTYILNPQPNSTTTVNKQQIIPNSTASSSLLTLIPPGTTSPKIQTLNSVTISSTNDNDKSTTTTNSNQSVFLKNRVTLVQPLITTNSTSSTTNNSSTKLVIQPNTNSTTTNQNFWQQQSQTQPTKIFSIPPSTILPTSKMLSRPVQLIPTSISSSEHHHHHQHHHHPHITHVQTIKTEKTDNTNSYPISMHFGLSSPTTNDNPLNIQIPHSTKNFDSSSYIHMQLLPSTTTNTHLYSSPSSVLISTTQRSIDNNNHHSITTPIIREDEHQKKNRARLPLQPSIAQQTPTTTTTTTTIRQPKKHKLIDDEHISLTDQPLPKLPHYEQLDITPSTTTTTTTTATKKLPKSSRHRLLGKFSIENTTPTSITNDLTKTKNFSSDLISRKRRTTTTINKLILNENIKNDSLLNQTSIDQIDDELLKRLSQDFTYIDKRTGIRWIGTKTRPKSINTLVSRFSWKPKINHYEKYSDIIRTNPKRTVPVKSFDIIRKKLTQPWSSWRIDRLTTYLSDLTQDEQITLNQLSDISQLINIDDQSIRNTIEELIQDNIQRHRCFCEQLTQISSLLSSLLDHGNTLRDICSVSKTSTTKRTKER